MKYVQSFIILTAIIFFSACGGSRAPKVVPATPVNKPAPAAQSEKDLHENIVLLAKYKKYQILSDDGKNNARIKYDRKYTDKQTKEVKLHSSITYDVQNSAKDYTFSYVDSKNLGYNDVNISNTYTRYINMFDSTLKRMYRDPAYLGRMKNVVAGKNPDGTEKTAGKK
ncbi:MAG: hypothetical protein ABFR02_08380 [Campylobacterota bacterium]